MDVEQLMPVNPLTFRGAGLFTPKPTNWNAPGFFEGYNKSPTDLLVANPDPFYDDVKSSDPDLAIRMVERQMTQDFPHEILFDLFLRDERSGVDVKPQDVGVGISQIAPVLVQAFGNKNSIIAIEQPEIHIHPALQAELGDVFLESALGENKNTFLLETHSEHLILRILRRIRETTEGEMEGWPEALRKACPNGIHPEDVAVLYVKPGEEGAQVEQLRINELGEFIDEWPGGFFDERIREIL
jgi:predicted ATPase